MRVVFLRASLLLLVFTFNSYATKEKEGNEAKEERQKEIIVKEIITKVTNLTTQAFAKVPSQEKEQMLIKIKDKLNKASRFMGSEGDRYVKLVMEGVEAVAFGDADDSRKTALHKQQSKTRDQKQRHNETQHNLVTEVNYRGDDKSIKSKLVKSIAKKIESLTKVAFYKAKTKEEKQKILENIKQRVLEAAKKHKVMIRSKDEIKPYGDLVVEGVELVLQQELNDDAKMKSKLAYRSKLDENENYTAAGTSDENINGNNTESPINLIHFTSKLDVCDCTCMLEKICSKMSNLHKFSCHDDASLIPIELLCDGEPDCSDLSDEKQCAKNALKKLENASHVIEEVQHILPRHCLKTSFEQSLLSKQNTILNVVLEQQIEFLKKYYPIHDDYFQQLNNTIVKSVVNEVGVVVSSVGYAMQAVFCAHEKEKVLTRRGGLLLDEDIDDLFTDRSWIPSLCNCSKQFCAQKNCSSTCQRSCWQRYSLGRWSCPAVSGKISVSLDRICDGKIDCYDESDEHECGTGKGAQKFEAIEMYNTVLEALSTKTALGEFHSVFNKVNDMKTSVKELQRYSTVEETDAPTVKGLRQKCFNKLRDVYEDVLYKADIFEKVDEVYLLLVSVNEKLVRAMKRSKTGNEKLVLDDECLCRGENCSMTTCSSICVRICSIKTKITRYICRDSMNKSVSIRSICNGKQDCPSGDDEENCKIDLCRKHHLVLLRNSIKNAKNRFEGNAIEDAIKAWKTKVTNNLLVNETKAEYSSRRGLQQVVREVLHDLTMTYGALGNSRRTGMERNIEKFLELARIVKDVLRTCTK